VNISNTRDSDSAGMPTPVSLMVTSASSSGIPLGNAPSILNKSFTITADIDVPRAGSEGMIVTAGGRFGGYGLYLLKGKPVFVCNLLDLKRTAGRVVWAARTG